MSVLGVVLILIFNPLGIYHLYAGISPVGRDLPIWVIRISILIDHLASGELRAVN